MGLRLAVGAGGVLIIVVLGLTRTASATQTRGGVDAPGAGAAALPPLPTPTIPSGPTLGPLLPGLAPALTPPLSQVAAIGAQRQAAPVGLLASPVLGSAATIPSGVSEAGREVLGTLESGVWSPVEAAFSLAGPSPPRATWPGSPGPLVGNQPSRPHRAGPPHPPTAWFDVRPGPSSGAGALPGPLGGDQPSRSHRADDGPPLAVAATRAPVQGPNGQGPGDPARDPGRSPSPPRPGHGHDLGLLAAALLLVSLLAARAPPAGLSTPHAWGPVPQARPG